MALINNVKFTIFDQVIPRDQIPPMIEISGDSMAYGTIELQLPIGSISTVTAQVYQVVPPTTGIDQWSRLQPNLYNGTILNYSSQQLASGNVKITWKFNPQSLIPWHKECFSIEFFVNTTTQASTAQYAPKVIIKINNPVDFTGYTGVAGGSFFIGATGVQGPTGIRGITGLALGSTGISGVTGLYGQTGILGQTGIQGITGLSLGATGLQGLTGFYGQTGIQGPTGVQGLTGLYGQTGIRGVTGFYGQTGILGQTGVQGLTGLYGQTGVQGLTGFYGQTGIKGDTGVQGLTGLYGQTGLRGLTGFYGQTGIAGNTGVQGLTGLYGQTGVQGNTGFYGQTGLQGNTGFYGQTGLRGQTGLQGLTGFYGQTGLQGATGFYGQTGIQGLTGFYGQTGLQGNTGIAGLTGVVGGSAFGAVLINWSVFPSGTAITTGTYTSGFGVPEEINGAYLTNVTAVVDTTGTTNTTDVQLHRKRSGVDATMLSSKCQVGSGFYYGNNGVVDFSRRVINVGDTLYVSVDTTSVTAPLGLNVTATFN